MKTVNRTWWNLAALALVATVCGCAKTAVQPKYEQWTAGPVVLRPGRVFVYDFAIT
jgi:hypothetical protein